MKYIFFILFTSTLFAGCKKEQDKKLLGGYFKFTVNGGAEKKIENGSGLYENTFSCELFGDTALYINILKSYEGIGFYIKASKINNGTYTFNQINRAYYTNPEDYKRYNTDATHTGQATIQRGTFQATSLLNTMQGTFNFTLVDTFSGKSIDITNGSFLMEITER